MQLQEILKTYEESLGKLKDGFQKSERAEVVKKFVDRLNAERVQNNYKALPPSFYAIKMAESGLKTNHDLYWFYRYCEDAQNFSKTWWWSMKSETPKVKHKIITRRKGIWKIPDNF